MFLLLSGLLLLGGASRPVAMVIDVAGKVEVRSAHATPQSAKRMRPVHADDRLSAADKAHVTLVFLDNGVREILKGKAEATVAKNGCEPRSLVTRIQAPKKLPSVNEPDSKLSPRGAGLSIVLNELGASMPGFVGQCLAAGAIQPASRGNDGEIFFDVADEAKLQQLRANYPRFSATLRDALFAHARASQVEGLARYLLQKQPADQMRAHAYALVLSADAARRQRDLASARRDYGKAVEALGVDQAVAVLGKDVMNWLENKEITTPVVLGRQAKYFVEASDRLMALVTNAGKSGYALRRSTSALGGGWLNQSRTDWVRCLTVELKAGQSYQFLAAGDSDAKDIDLDVLDARGKLVAKDDELNRDAAVRFQPAVAGAYTMRLRLFESRGAAPCAVVGIVLERDAEGPSGYEYARFVHDAVVQVGKLIDRAAGAGYQAGPACILGGAWLKQDKDSWMALSMVHLTQGKEYRFLAGGDLDAKGVAIQLVDPTNPDKVLASNRQSGGGFIDFVPNASGNYLVRLALYESRDNVPCFCLGVVTAK